MSATVVLLCAQALLIQIAFTYAVPCTSSAAVEADFAGFGCGGLGSTLPCAYNGFATPCGCDGFAYPFAYEGFGDPFAYDGFATQWAFNGYPGWAGRDLIYNGLYPAIASAVEFTPTTSGGFYVTSASPLPPTGITVVSENVYDGILAVAGEVPFVGTTGMAGILPTCGSGAINHACGNRINIMVSDTVIAPGPIIAPSCNSATYGYCNGFYY